MDNGRLEWGSDNLDTVFAQRRNLMSPSFLAMLRDVIRFGKEAPKVLDPAVHHIYRNMTLGEYLAHERYSKAFTQNYVLPMCAAVWSVPNAQVRGRDLASEGQPNKHMYTRRALYARFAGASVPRSDAHPLLGQSSPA